MTLEQTHKHWTIKIGVDIFTPISGLYQHWVNVYYKDLVVGEPTVLNKKKKLDPYMWFESYELFTYSGCKGMDSEIWQRMIHDLDGMRVDAR